MSAMSKKTCITTKQNKLVELKQQGNIAFQLLVKSQNLNLNIDLKKVMKFQLTPVPYCLGTSDGYLAKTNKAKGYHFVTKDSQDAMKPQQNETLLIVDGNTIFHCLTELPDTFKGICEKIFKAIPNTSDVVFSTDTYQRGSIKAMERQRRGTGERLLIKSANMRRPADWKEFLSNDENKERLIELLLDVWSDESFKSVQ